MIQSSARAEDDASKTAARTATSGRLIRSWISERAGKAERAGADEDRRRRGGRMFVREDPQREERGAGREAEDSEDEAGVGDGLLRLAARDFARERRRARSRAALLLQIGVRAVRRDARGGEDDHADDA